MWDAGVVWEAPSIHEAARRCAKVVGLGRDCIERTLLRTLPKVRDRHRRVKCEKTVHLPPPHTAASCCHAVHVISSVLTWMWNVIRRDTSVAKVKITPLEYIFL